MSGQRINIKVAGSVFQMTAISPQMERDLRLAAEEINTMLKELELDFQNQDTEDRLALIAIRQCVAKRIAQDRVAELEDETNTLNDALSSYLKGEGI